MADLGWDVARLVRLVYPIADGSTTEVIEVIPFLDTFPGPASDMKLHVIQGRPKNLQESVAHATVVK